MSETSTSPTTQPAEPQANSASPFDPLVQSLIQAGIESATDALTAKIGELEAGQNAHATQLQNVTQTVSQVVETVATHGSQIAAVVDLVKGAPSASDVASLTDTVSKMLPHVLSWASVKLSHFWGTSTNPNVTLDTPAQPPK